MFLLRKKIETKCLWIVERSSRISALAPIQFQTDSQKFARISANQPRHAFEFEFLEPVQGSRSFFTGKIILAGEHLLRSANETFVSRAIDCHEQVVNSWPVFTTPGPATTFFPSRRIDPSHRVTPCCPCKLPRASSSRIYRRFSERSPRGCAGFAAGFCVSSIHEIYLEIWQFFSNFLFFFFFNLAIFSLVLF